MPKSAIIGFAAKKKYLFLIELGRGNIYISDLVGLQQIFGVDYAEFFKGISTDR